MSNVKIPFFFYEEVDKVIFVRTNKFILLCDEVMCYESPDWSNMETCHNVIWCMAINPRSSAVDGNMKIVPPTSLISISNVLSQQLLVKYRNCHQIR